ncbi:MAG: glycosyltransferase family 9 protein [Planctomycetes bacterium]|nr:glycosyltransferase family 9 protein [Planctomycetota bacterium]
MAEPVRTDAPNILIVRPSALGDVARTVPALVSIRRAYPNSRIDWLVQDSYSDVIWYHPDLTGVVLFPRRRFGAMWRNPAAANQARLWLKEVRRTHYDMVFDLQGLSRSGWITRLTGARRRIGFSDARELAWLHYNRRHRIKKDVRHTVDRMLALVEAEGIPPVREMRLYTAETDRLWVDSLLTRYGVQDSGYFVIAPTARWRSKCWPIDRFAQVVFRLLDTGRAGKFGIILAAPDEEAQLQPLLDALRHDNRVISPTTTVGQMMAILERTRLLVCNDSAPLHIAVGFNRPLITVFGPTDPAEVGPYKRDTCVIRAPGTEHGVPAKFRRNRGDTTLISRIDFETVWRAIERETLRPVPPVLPPPML